MLNTFVMALLKKINAHHLGLMILQGFLQVLHLRNCCHSKIYSTFAVLLPDAYRGFVYFLKEIEVVRRLALGGGCELRDKSQDRRKGYRVNRVMWNDTLL